MLPDAKQPEVVIVGEAPLALNGAVECLHHRDKLKPDAPAGNAKTRENRRMPRVTKIVGLIMSLVEEAE